MTYFKISSDKLRLCNTSINPVTFRCKKFCNYFKPFSFNNIIKRQLITESRCRTLRQLYVPTTLPRAPVNEVMRDFAKNLANPLPLIGLYTSYLITQ